jgi:phage terminase large subunit
VSAEGAVYEFDPRLHLIDPFPVPAHWPRVRSFDFGYTNPFVCLWLTLDPDGRLYLYRELYMTRRTVKVHAATVNEFSRLERYEASVSDHDAEDRATLAENGIHTLPAVKAIRPGLDAVAERLKVAGDGKPRLFVFRGALVERDEELAAARRPVCTEQEFDAYQWPKAADGKALKDVPVDRDNHGLDALRYAVVWADARQRGGVGYATAPAGETVFGQLPADTFL